MANYKTGAQRHNDRMDKIFAEAKRLNAKYHCIYDHDHAANNYKDCEWHN